MVNQDKKDNRGGKREGAGRPKGTSKLYAFRADKEVSAFIAVSYTHLTLPTKLEV